MVVPKYPVKQDAAVAAATVQVAAPVAVHLVQVVADPTFEYPDAHVD